MGTPVPGVICGPGAGSCSRRGLTFLRRRQIHAGPASLGEADRDHLPGGTRAMLATSDLVDFLADELPGLDGRRLASRLVAPGGADGLLLRHGGLLSSMALEILDIA